MWSYGNYMNISIGNLLKYFATLSVSFHDINSLFGFFTFDTSNREKVPRIQNVDI